MQAHVAMSSPKLVLSFLKLFPYIVIQKGGIQPFFPFVPKNQSTPWSPLARGILTGAYSGGFETGTTNRSKGADRKRTESLYRGRRTFDIAERVVEVANKRGAKPAQVALAWLAGKSAS